MWLSIIVKIIISFIIILIGHHLWNRFTDSYSTKKTKDIIGSQIQKYNSLLEEAQRKHINSQHSSNDSMKMELENFMNEMEFT